MAGEESVFKNFFKGNTLRIALIVAVALNILLLVYIGIDKCVTRPNLMRDNFNFGFNESSKIITYLYEQQLAVVPNKTVMQNYWRARVIFDYETRQTYGIGTLMQWELNQDIVQKMMSNYNYEYKASKPTKLSWIIDSDNLSSRFGFRKNPFAKYVGGMPTIGFHQAVDIIAPIGTKVRSCLAGKVVFTSDNYLGYGRVVMVQHERGLMSIYGHLKSRLVDVGDTIRKGQLIAFSGNTGRSTGPHLHFEMRANNNPINPLMFEFEN